MQFVTASDTAHFISARKSADGSSCEQKAATAALAMPSLTESEGNTSFIVFLTFFIFHQSFRF